MSLDGMGQRRLLVRPRIQLHQWIATSSRQRIVSAPVRSAWKISGPDHMGYLLHRVLLDAADPGGVQDQLDGSDCCQC